MKRSAIPLLAAAVCGGCQNLEMVAPVEEGAYDRCEHPAWEAARQALRASDDEAAYRALEQVVAMCPDFVAGHARWIEVATRLGGDREAAMRAWYAQAADERGSPVLPWARARLENNDSRRVDLLDEAVARDASFYPAYIDLAEIWGRSGYRDQTAKQLDYLQKAEQAQPDSPDANLGLAKVLVSLGRGEEAVPYFERYLRMRPDDRESVRDFVRLLVYELGRVDDADTWIARLLSADADDVAAQMDAAAATWLRGDRARAAELYRRVLEQDPTHARAVLNLGNLWFQDPARNDPERDEDWRKARAAYRYFLQLDEYADVQDLRDLLVSVPFRLQAIDRALGPLAPDAPAVELDDLGVAATR